MSPFALLLCSLAPLVFAPVLARIASRSVALHAAFDSFVAVTIGAVTVLHVLPEVIEIAGPPVIVVAALGFVLPIVLHYGMHRLERKALPTMIALVLLGLALHAVADGLALVGPEFDPKMPPLTLAVLLHRLPVALAIWWFARPALGTLAAALLLGAIGLGTVAGYAAAGDFWLAIDSPQVAYAQALIAGMLFHVLLGHHRPRALHDGDARRLRVGFLVGLALGTGFAIALILLPDHPGETHALEWMPIVGLAAVVTYVARSRLVAPSHSH